MKAFRQSQILELIDKEAITSQEGLREELQARGINPSRFERVTIAVKGAGVAINFTMGARP